MHRLSLFFAWRYLFSKKSTNMINLIAGVAMTGMAVGSMAMILVLSVFNGFEDLVISLYNKFDADIKIEALEGKTFEYDSDFAAILKSINGIEFVSPIIQENVIVRYGEREYIATLKGVSRNYTDIAGIDSSIIRGSFLLEDQDRQFTVIGAGIEQALGVNLEDPLSQLVVYVPKRGAKISIRPDKAFNRKTIIPSGVFAIQQEFDSKYFFVPIEFARDILDYKNEVSALELTLEDDSKAEEVIAALESGLGSDFVIKNRFQQNAFLYKVMQTEKWAVFAILSFILAIAAFNIVGSLTMLVIEKSKDISILKTMGATNGLVQQIFLLEGLLSSLIGSFAGILLAVIVCYLQQEFGIIKLQGSGTFVIDAYPVKMKFNDFAWVIGIIVFISLIASLLPARRAARQSMLFKEE